MTNFCGTVLSGNLSLSDQVKVAACETAWWSNRDAGCNSLLRACYRDVWAEEMITLYRDGVRGYLIPEWTEPRNPSTEAQIISFLVNHHTYLKYNADGGEPLIRAMWHEFTESVLNPDKYEDRFPVNPCLLFPLSEKCDGTTAMSEQYRQELQKYDKENGGILGQLTNLMQSSALLIAAGVGLFLIIKSTLK